MTAPDTENNQYRLLDAARLVESVMATLDLQESQCECCSRRNYRNWEEAQTHTELEAIARKLRRFAKGV